MTLEQLRSFIEIAATGSFREAADRLHATQSTVSMRIKALEALVGQRLFQRSKRGATLTPAGHRFRPQALKALQAMDAALRAGAVAGEGSETLALSMQITLWEELIADWIEWMRARRPDVVLSVETNFSDQTIAAVAEGTVDLGVCFTPRLLPGIRVEKLADDPLVLVRSPGLEESGWRERYLSVYWGEAFERSLAAAFADLGPAVFRTTLPAIARQQLLRGEGAAYLLERSVRGALAEGRLALVRDAPVIPRPIYAVVGEPVADRPLVRQALQGIAACLNAGDGGVPIGAAGR